MSHASGSLRETSLQRRTRTQEAAAKAAAMKKHVVAAEAIARRADFDRELRALGRGCSIEKTEERGVTLPQLRAVVANIERRCLPEAWEGSRWLGDGWAMLPLEPENVSLYETDTYITRPATVARRCSIVELFAAAPQPPNWFVSHFWGEPVKEFVACIVQHSANRKVGGAPYWVCAFANNQWTLGVEMTTDPAETSFFKAMQLTIGTVSVVDVDAKCYRRIWCQYECFVALVRTDRDYLYDVYTCHDDTGERRACRGRQVTKRPDDVHL
jgi:hypothetical protein